MAPWSARRPLFASVAGLTPEAPTLSGAPAILPPGAMSAWADPTYLVELFPEEEPIVSRAVEKRRREFASGRACARLALGELGVAPVAILSGAHREPLWPPGVVGSLTHTHGLCWAAVAPGARFRGLGVDAEPDVPLAPALARRVCSPAETARAAGVGLDAGILAHVVFSAKEAVYKCQFPTSGTYLGFGDVTLELAEGSFRGVLGVGAGPFAAGHSFEGRWERRAGFIFSAAWEAAPP